MNITSSTYLVIAGTELVETRSSKAKAIEIAETFRGENLVMVATSKGNVVHEIRPVTERAKPFTRVEVPSFEAPSIEGFVAAYQRARVGAVVYRAEDKSGYLVVQPRTGFRVEAANTTEAREVTNALAAAHREARAQEAKEAAEAKAEAKAAKAAAKAAKAAELVEA